MSEKQDLFVQRIEELVQRTIDWTEPHDWVTKRYPKRMRNEAGTEFEVPALYLQKGPVRILLDPIAGSAPGADAVVDLYLMPTYDDLATLYFVDDRWTVHYAFAGEATQEVRVLPVEASTMNAVLDAIAEHAVPTI